MRHFLLRQRLRLYFFAEVMLWRHTLLDAYLRCMGTPLRYVMPKRNR